MFLLFDIGLTYCTDAKDIMFLLFAVYGEDKPKGVLKPWLKSTRGVRILNPHNHRHDA
jgi:hypothetical protein